MRLRIVLILLSVFAVLSCTSCIQIADNGAKTGGTTVSGGGSGEGDVPVIDRTDPLLILVNKSHPLAGDYVPSELVEVTSVSTYDGRLLQRETNEALERMMEAMRRAGITDVMVTSPYRSYAKQEELFSGYLAREQKTISPEARAVLGADYLKAKYEDHGLTGLDAADARLVVLSYSAAPGTSEHQTGLCVDLITEEMNGTLDGRFAESAAYSWLCAHACEYGFILRYPEDKVSVTGYSYEPWHYRYVGVAHAKAIAAAGLVLEEYLAVG